MRPAESPEADKATLSGKVGASVSFAATYPSISSAYQSEDYDEFPIDVTPSRAISKIDFSRQTSDESLAEEKDNWLIIRVMILLLVLVAFPCLCRFAGLDSPGRCSVLIISILMINIAEVMPLWCTSLLVPVLGTLYAVLGDSRTTTETSTLLVSNIFNNTSFMVLGALVINAIFTKCGLEQRFMNWLMRSFLIDGPVFLLLLLFGGMFMCSVLYSGSLVLVAAITPVLRDGLRSRVLDANAAKRILLAVGFCANAGSCLLPISSPVGLVTVSLLADFDLKISVNTWAAIAVPVASLTMLATWVIFLIVFPNSKERQPEVQDEAFRRQSERLEIECVELTDWHLLFLGIGVLAVLGITVFPTQLEPIIGHSACLSLAVIVVVFGSGFMSREEFCQLDWDLLALVGGINVMAFMIRETGLGILMSSSLQKSGLLDGLPFQAILVVLVSGTVVISTFLGHQITGVLLLPLVVAFGIELGAPQTTTIIVATAVPFGMSWFNASMDNVVCYNASRRLGRRKVQLQNSDFRAVGIWTSIVAVLLFSTLGYTIAVYFYGTPGQPGVYGVTDEKLKPKVVRENLPGPEDWKAIEPSRGRKERREFRRELRADPHGEPRGEHSQESSEPPAPESLMELLARGALARGPLRTWGTSLPNVKRVRRHFRRGVAPHHSGIPPESQGNIAVGRSFGGEGPGSPDSGE